MKPERYFYTSAGALFLLLTFIGFRHYILGGTHPDGSPFHPALLALVELEAVEDGFLRFGGRDFG